MRARTETGAEKEKQREREGQSRAAAEKREGEGEQGKKRRERKKNDVSPFRFFFYVLFVRGSSSSFWCKSSQETRKQKRKESGKWGLGKLGLQKKTKKIKSAADLSLSSPVFLSLSSALRTRP